MHKRYLKWTLGLDWRIRTEYDQGGSKKVDERKSGKKSMGIQEKIGRRKGRGDSKKMYGGDERVREQGR